ncbi:MAG: hypothetical protein ACRDOO_04935 [Actinomadura sp.]
MADDQDSIDALAIEWSETLRRSGQVVVTFNSHHERDRYRKAGRKAGRLLDRPVKTRVLHRSVLIVLTDWMDNPLQVHVEDIRARKAIDEAFSAPDTQPPPAPSPRPMLKSVPPPSDDTI